MPEKENRIANPDGRLTEQGENRIAQAFLTFVVTTLNGEDMDKNDKQMDVKTVHDFLATMVHFLQTETKPHFDDVHPLILDLWNKAHQLDAPRRERKKTTTQ